MHNESRMSRTVPEAITKTRIPYDRNGSIAIVEIAQFKQVKGYRNSLTSDTIIWGLKFQDRKYALFGVLNL